MSRLLVAAGALLASALLVPGDAAAQRGFRGGFGGGGLRGGGIGGGFGGGGIRGGSFGGGAPMFRPGFGVGGLRGGAVGVRPGVGLGTGGAVAVARPGLGGFYRPGAGVYRPFYRGYYGRGWRYPSYGYYRGWRYPYYAGSYGWGYPYDDWGWGAGLVTGSIVGAAASTYPVYPAPVTSAIGGSCATPVRICTLINPAPVGIGCSCRVAGGRARGTVVGP